MSVQPLRCDACDVESIAYQLGNYADNPYIYGVTWRCPTCARTSVDVCTVGPLLPPEGACLNCGEPYAGASGDPECGLCGLLCSKTVEAFGPFPPKEEALRLVDELVGRGLIRRAFAVLDHALVEDDTLVDAWLAKLQLFERLQLHEAKLLMLEVAAEAGMPRILFIPFAGALHDAGRFEEAVEAYDLYLEAANEDFRPAALANKANSLVELGRYEEAEAHYRQALEREPDRGTHYTNYLRLLRRTGGSDVGLEVVAAGLERVAEEPYRVRMFEEQAFFLAELGRADEALAAAERALVLDSENARALALRSRALEMLGKAELARKTSERAVRLDPVKGGAARDEEPPSQNVAFWKRLFMRWS